MIDLRIQNGDIALITRRDLAIVDGKSATATLVQTILMGIDHTFSRRIKEILCSQSIRQMSNEAIAELLKEEVYERLVNTSLAVASILQVDTYIDKQKDTVKLVVRTQDKNNFVSQIQFIGKMFTDTFDMEPAEVVI